jgi:hypothetical protein
VPFLLLSVHISIVPEIMETKRIPSAVIAVVLDARLAIRKQIAILVTEHDRNTVAPNSSIAVVVIAYDHVTCIFVTAISIFHISCTARAKRRRKYALMLELPIWNGIISLLMNPIILSRETAPATRAIEIVRIRIKRRSVIGRLKVEQQAGMMPSIASINEIHGSVGHSTSNTDVHLHALETRVRGKPSTIKRFTQETSKI